MDFLEIGDFLTFKNLIGIYNKELEIKDKILGDKQYYRNNASYIYSKYLECHQNMGELINLLKCNCKNSLLDKRSRNSDKLFVDLYYKFNK